MRIIGPPSAPHATVGVNVAMTKGCHPEFAGDMFDALWSAGIRYGIDPVGVVAQAAKETGWGQFGGAVRREMRNTCGLKIARPGFVPGTEGDKTLAHAQFANWRVGALAHVQHLRAYAGWPLGLNELVVDPRYELALAAGREVPLSEFEQLSGRWAPSSTYGAEVATIARRLQAAA